MSEPLDSSYEEIVQKISAEEGYFQAGKSRSWRATMDVKLGRDLGASIAGMASETGKSAALLRDELSEFRTSLDRFRASMDGSGRKMANLTIVLCVVAGIQALPALI